MKELDSEDNCLKGMEENETNEKEIVTQGAAYLNKNSIYKAESDENANLYSSNVFNWIRRNSAVTGLIEFYIEEYENKKVSIKSWQKELLKALCSILVLCTFALVFSMIYAATNKTVCNMFEVVLPALIAFLSSLLSLLGIAFKYVFPIKEDETMAKIITSVITNDVKGQEVHKGYKK